MTLVKAPDGRAIRQAVRLHEDPAAAARTAGLVYVSTEAPGIRRVRRGRGFSYVDPSGAPVPAKVRERISALVIPPAWTEVWICTETNGHLQCVGVDDRGRKQYLYHPLWREVRDRAAFDRLAIVGAVLPTIRQTVAAQMRRRTIDRDRIQAAMVHLLDLTGIRIGNEIYEKSNRTVGLTTLRWSHVTLTTRSFTLRFPAKSGARAEIRVADAPLTRLLIATRGGKRARVFAWTVLRCAPRT